MICKADFFLFPSLLCCCYAAVITRYSSHLSDEKSKCKRVACVGDSITQGQPFGTPWPEQLQNMLGSAYCVENFGNGGKYMQKSREFKDRIDSGALAPYWDTIEYTHSKAFQPDVVFIMLGTNDGRSWMWSPKVEQNFESDYHDMVDQFKHLKSKPKIWLMLPPPIYLDGTLGGMDQSLINDIIPDIIKRVAKDCGLATPLDAQAPFKEKCPDLTQNDCTYIHATLPFPGIKETDGCHPTSDGFKMIAEVAKNALQESS